MTLDEDDNLPTLAELHQKIDHMKISSLSSIQFDESGKRFLQQLYEELSTNSFYNYSFGQYYKKVLDGVIAQVTEEKKKAASGSGGNAGSGGGSGGAQGNAKPNKFGGIDQNNLFENWIAGDDHKEFFKRVIKCFHRVNFYNLLIL